ncbi:MAG: autotransporter-associated beta strand repeat-containing protein [Akkermansia sp.]|nr:autotransporter-associated beta strand repeat-containing protein [Akkermansia sp.]
MVEKVQTAGWKRFLKSGLAMALAVCALPAMAQTEETAEGEKHAAAPLTMSAPQRHARAARAKALAAPLVQNGMDSVSAFELAWAALAAEEAGRGDAETLLAEGQMDSPESAVNALSAEEFAALLAALEEQKGHIEQSHSVGMQALMRRLAQLMHNEDSALMIGKAQGMTTFPNPNWLLEPASPAFLPPGRPGGSDHDTIIDAVEEEEEKPEELVSALAETETEPEPGLQLFSLFSLDMPEEPQPKARSLGVSLMSSFGGFGGGFGGFGGAAPMSLMSFSAPSLMADLGSDAPGGDVTWKGNLDALTDGVSATFDKSSTALDVTLTDVWRPYEIIVNDTGVAMTKRGEATDKIGYAFNGKGSIADYEDEMGNVHATSLTKKGSGILVLANSGNTYSGGTDVQQGTLYVADQGALGTGEVTLHDGTEMWVNYTWNNDYSSSFRNPEVSNTINLANGASSTISYGAFPYQKVLGKDSTRIWRNMYLTGGVTGNEDSHLFLQVYTSRYGVNSSNTYTTNRLHLGGTVSMRAEVWYGGFILNRTDALTRDERFEGTVTLGNRVNTSTLTVDNLNTSSGRESGAVKLVLSDDVLEYATLDATREWNWYKESTGNGDNNKLLLTGVYTGGSITASASEALKKAYADAGGTDKNYGDYGLRQTHSHTILISNNSKVGELKADLLGVTQDSYRDAIEWSEALEVGMVRVATLEENATLTLGKEGSTAASWFSGTVGFENLLCDMDGDGKDTMTKANMNGLSSEPTTKLGVSLVKVGDNTQYIHSAKLRNLDVQGGTLGFNNVELVNNLTLSSGTTLQLGVQNEQWKDKGTVNLLVGDHSGDKHRFAVVTADTDTRAKGAPLSARVEGSLKLDTSTELAFEVSTQAQDSGERMNIVPAWVKEEDKLKGQTEYLSSHSLLQVTAATQRTDADKGGILTLNNDTPITISGVNFLKEDYEDKVYFLAAADKIAVNKNGVIGNASDFDTRVITLGYGYYGLISTIDGHGTNLGSGYSAYDTGHADYLGQDYLVMRVAADPTRSWTGSTQTSSTTHAANVWTAAPEKTYADYLEHTGKMPDAQWKENRAYTDGVSVKFGNLWMPTKWQEYLENNPDAKVEDFAQNLTSNLVTKVEGTTFTEANGTQDGKGNGTTVTIAGIENGREGSTYDGVRMEGHNDHYEKVVIEGTVRPGYVTINSDFNLQQGDGSYVTVQDDTNYVFTGTGSIADATPEMMKEIYSSLLGEDGSSSMLDNWKTGLSKGGTGALVMLTENSYSGGSFLSGGLTVMGNKWALGMENPTLSKDNAAAKGGAVEMSYGAGLMADYLTKDSTLGGVADTMSETVLSNALTITHMADYNNTLAKGDAQLLNRYDSILSVGTLTSYDDAILTLRGVSLAEDSELARREGDDRLFNTYAKYIITNPVKAQGTIRMAGYLYGDDGSLVNVNGDAYMNGGGKVQLTLTGHKAGASYDVLWGHTTIDLSLNGSKENVLAIGTRIIPGKDGSVEINQNGATPLEVELHTLKDDGLSGHNARVINEASAGQMNGLDRTAYQVTLKLNPSSDASFSGDIGFGMGQNAEGAAMPSRGYISLVKSGAALQSVGNARLLDLTVNGSGLMHVQESLSARYIVTTNPGVQHIHVGHVGDAVLSHTLTVGKDGILSFGNSLSATSNMGANDPLAGLKATETSKDYGYELTYVLLKDGATLTGCGNWYTDKGIAVAGGASITFNTHDYSMDNTVSTDMAVYGDEGQRLHDAFDDSHIFWLNRALSGDKVTLNLVNEQMSAGATEDERGKATSNGYIITHDLNEYNSTENSKVKYGLMGGSTVNIGAKTILQSYVDAKNDSGIEYNVTGTDAALQFLDTTGGSKVSTSGVVSYVNKATLAEGGRIILGGASAANNNTLVNTDAAAADITKDADVVITNKEGQTASVTGMTVNTKNVKENNVTYETTLSASGSRATVEHAEMTAKQGNTRVQDTDINTSLVHLKNKCSVTMEDVLVSADSKVEGEGPASGTTGAAAVFQGATAASNQNVTATIPSFSTGSVTLTDADTRINTTLTTVENVVKNDVLIQVAKADQLSRTDVGGKGLTLGLSQETLEKATAAGVRYLAIQVSDSGRFLYEQQAVLESVKLTDHNGATYTNPAYEYRVVSSKEVADFIGVDQSEVSNTVIYIEVSETPEPTTATLSLLALAALMARRKRNK